LDIVTKGWWEKINIFIGWSGEISKIIAEGIREWIPQVLQKIDKTFISTKDIEKGSVWFNDITDKLKKTDIGIFCITPENLNSIWMHYEAGAISNKDKTNVCSLLYKLKKIEINGPFSYFQKTDFEKNDLFNLINLINNKCPKSLKTPENILNKNFKAFWRILNKAEKNADKLFNDRVIINQIPLSTASTIETYLKNISELVNYNNNFLRKGEFKLSNEQMETLEKKLSPSFSPLAIEQLNKTYLKMKSCFEKEEEASIEELKTVFEDFKNPINHIINSVNPINLIPVDTPNYTKKMK